MHRASDRFRAQGIGLAAITYDNPETMKDFAARYQIEYPLLADPQSDIIRRFGMLDPDNTSNNRPEYGARDFAYPGYYYVSPDGVVKEKFLDENFNNRFTAGNVIAKLFPELIEESGPVEAPHLKFAVGQSDREANPGSRVNLVVDVTLPPGVHVYAPGVEHYKPIELAVDAPPGFQVLPAAYPRSKVMRLPVINEKVPVYEGRVRLEREVVISAEVPYLKQVGCPEWDGLTATLEGRLKYQACDAKKCYPPTEVPLTWKVQVRQLDFLRPQPENQKVHGG